MSLSVTSSGSRSSLSASYEPPEPEDPVKKIRWRNAFILSKQDSETLKSLDRKLSEPIFARCDTFGMDVGQALVRYACKAASEAKDASVMAKIVFDFMRSEPVKRSIVFNTMPDSAIILLNQHLNSSQTAAGKDLVRCITEIKVKVDLIVDSLALVRRKSKDDKLSSEKKLSAVILTTGLKKAAAAYETVVKAILDAGDNIRVSEEHLGAVRAVFDGYRTLMSKIDEHELLKKNRYLKNQLKVLLPFYDSSYRQLEEQGAPVAGMPDDQRMLGYAVLGSGVKNPGRMPFKSWEACLTAMQESVSAALAHLAYAKGRGIARDCLPGNVKELCSVIESLAAGGVGASDDARKRKVKLWAIEQQLRPEDGTVDLKVAYNISFGDHSGCLTVRAQLNKQVVGQLALEGSIYSLGRPAGEEGRLDHLRRFIIEKILGKHDGPGEPLEGIELFAPQDAIHFRFNVPCSGADDGYLDLLLTNLQAIWNCLCVEQP